MNNFIDEEIDLSQETITTSCVREKIPTMTLDKFLLKEIKPREMLLAPWLPRQGIGMIHAEAGIGKTYFSLSVAWAIASGTSFVGWQAPKPCKVLYLDGEMPEITMQERLAAIIKMTQKSEYASNFTLFTPDFLQDRMLDLSRDRDQGNILEEIKENKYDLVVIDNVSSLMPNVKENEADSWNIIQGWELQIRKMGVSVLRVQHTGKNGTHRGSSKHQDIVDTTIHLVKPQDHDARDGARFEVNFTKSRGFYGEDAASFEVTLSVDENLQPIWLTKNMEQSIYDRIINLANDGLSQKDICIELQIEKSKVCRYFNRGLQEGKIKKPHYESHARHR